MRASLRLANLSERRHVQSREPGLDLSHELVGRVTRSDVGIGYPINMSNPHLPHPKIGRRGVAFFGPQRLATCGATTGNRVSLWDTGTGHRLRSWPLKGVHPQYLAADAVSQQVIYAGNDRIALLNANTGDVLATAAPAGHTTALAVDWHKRLVVQARTTPAGEALPRWLHPVVGP